MAKDSESKRDPASEPESQQTSGKPKPPTFDVVRRRVGGKKAAKGGRKKGGKKR